jgi:hypothetical protein
MIALLVWWKIISRQEGGIDPDQFSMPAFAAG